MRLFPVAVAINWHLTILTHDMRKQVHRSTEPISETFKHLAGNKSLIWQFALLEISVCAAFEGGRFTWWEHMVNTPAGIVLMREIPYLGRIPRLLYIF